jgi:hypothetical protein
MPTERDRKLKGAEKRIEQQARDGGFEAGRARQLARRAVEKADAVKDKLGHWDKR